MKAPEFGIERNGYNKQEVDAYIDEIRAEHGRLSVLCVQHQAHIRALTMKGASGKRQRPPMNAPRAPHPAQAATPVQVNPDKMGYESRSAVDMKALDAVDREYAQASSSHALVATKRKTRISDVIFYLVLAIGLVVLFSFFSSGTGAPRSLAGYSAMRVLTESMQDEIPKDSLIVTKEVESNTLQIGDDITFLVDADTTVTHRIVGIQENYANTGARGFQTQGIMNSVADREIVPAQNVVGKVVFHNLFLGQALAFIRENVLWIGIFAALFIGLFAALRVVLSNGDSPARKRGIQHEQSA